LPQALDPTRVIHATTPIGGLNGDKAPDIVVPNKKGVFLFEQIRPAARPG
jgi:hypothetical protein